MVSDSILESRMNAHTPHSGRLSSWAKEAPTRAATTMEYFMMIEVIVSMEWV